MEEYAFDAKRSKETKHKVVFQEVKTEGPIAVGGLYVEKWLIDALSNGSVLEQIKVTIEAA